MKVYFTDKQVPEISTLEDVQRRAVRDGAFDLFCKDHPPARWQVRLANGLTIGVGVTLAFILSHRFWIQLLIGTIAVLVAGFLFQSFLTEQLRPYFRRYIETHRRKVSRAA